MSGADEVSFTGVNSLVQILERTPHGRDVATVLHKMGLWTTDQHRLVAQRRAFNPKLSALSPEQLSDEAGYWTSELGRISELHGLLSGQKTLLEMQSKAAKATARARIRRNAEADAKLSVSQIADSAEEDLTVIDVESKLAFVIVTLASVSAAKEATTLYLSTLSREITHRGDQMKARIYG